MFNRLVTRNRWLIIFRQHLLTTRRTLSSIVQCQTGIVCPKMLFINPWILHGSYLSMKYLSGTPPLLVKGSRDSSVRSEGHADSRCGIVTVGLTRLHFTLSITRHGLKSSTSWSLTNYWKRRRYITIFSIYRDILCQKFIFLLGHYQNKESPPWSVTLTWWWGSAPMTRKISKIWRRGATKSWPNSCRQIATQDQCSCAGFDFTADYGFIAVYLRLYSRLSRSSQPLRLYGRYL